MEYVRMPDTEFGPYSGPCSRCGKRSGISISGRTTLKVDCPDCGQFETTWDEFIKAWPDSAGEDPTQP